MLQTDASSLSIIIVIAQFGVPLATGASSQDCNCIAAVIILAMTMNNN